MVDGQRTPHGRELAERAFARLLDEVGDHWRDFVLVGGLVPSTLVEHGDAHQGTLDVDVLIPLALVYDREEEDFGWLETGLRRAGFAPMTPNVGWRWWTNVEEHPVLIEFLVDVPDNPGQEVALPGAQDLSAQNLAGPGPAIRDTRVAAFGGKNALVTDVAGYIVAKSRAVLWRGKQKDLYDLAYVIVHRLRTDGPALAQKVASAAEPDARWPRDILADVIAACDRYADRDSVGARAYATEARLAGVQRSEAQLADEAARAVRAFRAVLQRR